jgi:methylmalonyl-CoA mutase cobalamin-binding domain/chain
MLDDIIKKYNEAVFDTDKQRALKIIDDAVQSGVSPEDIVFQVIIPAVEQMIKAISEDFDTNLAQHYMASQIAAEVTEKMTALFKKTPITIGRVVMGTSSGDLHTLGKKIVIGCLRSMMIEVFDLGVNVSPEKFIEEAVKQKAEVIGISSMMVHTARGENGCLKVREILKTMDLEKSVKIIVGGAPYRFDRNLYKTVHADAWAPDGITAGKVVIDLINEVKKAKEL